jgi:hypothetical protein
MMTSLTSFKYAVAVLVMMAALVPVVVLDRPIPPDDSLPVALPLPDAVDGIKGITPLFCQNEECMAETSVESGKTNNCPHCGGPVSEKTLAEQRILPADTLLARKRYAGPSGAYTVSVVTGGLEQKSIHRPQQCLPAQGFAIDGRGLIKVRRERGGSLLLTSLRIRPANRAGSAGSVYAYWFTDGATETPYHLARLFHVAADRIFRHTVSRWSYISVSTPALSSSDDTDARLSAFVEDLHRQITVKQSTGDL